MKAVDHPFDIGNSPVRADGKLLEALLEFDTANRFGAKPRESHGEDELEAIEKEGLSSGILGARMPQLAIKHTNTSAKSAVATMTSTPNGRLGFLSGVGGTVSSAMIPNIVQSALTRVGLFLAGSLREEISAIRLAPPVVRHSSWRLTQIAEKQIPLALPFGSVGMTRNDKGWAAIAPHRRGGCVPC